MRACVLYRINPEKRRAQRIGGRPAGKLEKRDRAYDVQCRQREWDSIVAMRSNVLWDKVRGIRKAEANKVKNSDRSSDW